MYDIVSIAEKAMAIKEQWKGATQWEILDRLGIIYDFTDLGSARKGLKGYCTCFFSQYFIAINHNLPDYLQELVAMHELGHIILSPELLKNGNFMVDSNLSIATDRAEIAANYFAAEMMIDDDELILLIKCGYTIQESAASLRVPDAFVILKCEILTEFRYKLRLQDMPDVDCLGDDIIGMENF